MNGQSGKLQQSEGTERIQELEAQCAAMREALRADSRPCIGCNADAPTDTDPQLDERHHVPTCRSRLTRTALATDAGKAMLERAKEAERERDHHRRIAEERVDAVDRADKAERERDEERTQRVRLTSDLVNADRRYNQALEDAAKVAEAQPYYPDTHRGMRQEWVKEQIAAKVRALKTGGGT